MGGKRRASPTTQTTNDHTGGNDGVDASHTAYIANPLATAAAASLALATAAGAAPTGTTAIAPALSLPPTRSETFRSNGNLTNLQRKAICEFYTKSGGVMSQKDLALWAKHEFDLTKTPAQSTISGILKRQHEFIHMSSLELQIKKRRVVHHPLLDQALANWVIHSAHRGLTIQGDMTKDKAKHFAKMLAIPDAEQLEFSNGWLHSFQQRHNFSFRKFNRDKTKLAPTNATAGAIHGGPLPLDASEEMSKRPSLAHVIYFTTIEAFRTATAHYKRTNIFAMDETSVLYTLSPTHRAFDTDDALATTKRIVVTLAANADGSETLPPLYVSHFENPQCFRNKPAEAFGLHYCWNYRAWMTGVVFSRYLERLDVAMQAQKRHILLIINDAPSHTVAHLELTHIVLVVLPEGTAQVLHPITAHLILPFKQRYRRYHLQYVLDRSTGDGGDTGIQTENTGIATETTPLTRPPVFAVDVLQAMKWATQSWSDVPRTTIERAWAATHLVPDRVLLLDSTTSTNASAVAMDDRDRALLQTELLHLLVQLQLPDVVSLSDYLDDDATCDHSKHEEFFEVVQHADDVPDDDVISSPSDDAVAAAPRKRESHKPHTNARANASGTTGITDNTGIGSSSKTTTSTAAAGKSSSSNTTSNTTSLELSLQDKLKAFRDVMQVLQDRNDADDSAMTALRRVEDAIRAEAQRVGVATAVVKATGNDADAHAAGVFDSAELDFDGLGSSGNAAVAAAAAAAAQAADDAMIHEHDVENGDGEVFDQAVI